MESVKVAFLSVGHGDSTVIIFPDRKSGAVIDTPKAQITLDYLVDNNIESLKWVMISHSHVDHIHGIVNLIDQLYLNNKIVETIYYNRDTIKIFQEQKRKGRFRTTLDDLLRLIEDGIIKNPGLPATINSSFAPIDGVEIKIIYPSHDDITRTVVHSKNVNDASVVVHLCYGQNSILFTGDLSENGWNWLKARNQNITSNILKFPHHGSWFESVPNFINGINPQYIIISCGDTSDTKYGLPARKTMDFLNMKNIKIFTTKSSHQEFIITLETIRIPSSGN